jgi:hypothetical protein
VKVSCVERTECLLLKITYIYSIGICFVKPLGLDLKVRKLFDLVSPEENAEQWILLYVPLLRIRLLDKRATVLEACHLGDLNIGFLKSFCSKELGRILRIINSLYQWSK